MTEPSPGVDRNRFLLTNLVILSIFILTLIFLAASYPTLLAPPPTSTPTITLTPLPTSTATLTPTPTLSPTPTRTLLPTFTATVTQTPTPTPPFPQTPTPTGPPTLTPARPVANDQSYSLKDWTPDTAAALIDLVGYYPYTLQLKDFDQSAAFYSAFGYAADAEQVALLQFPDAPQAKAWRWDMAYNLARSADPAAAESYTELILPALNQGETNPDGLHDWFQQNEPRASLYTIPLKPPSGFTSSYLVEVRARGSAFIWLLETPGSYQTFVLEQSFNFANDPNLAYVISDFTGDGFEEIAIYTSNPQTEFRLDPPRVFDLSQVPAVELPFRSNGATFEVGTNFRARWVVDEPVAGNPTTLVAVVETFPACPVTIRRAYRYEEGWFVFQNIVFSVEPAQATLAFCRYAADHAILVWGPDAAIQIMQPILPDWPPVTDEAGEPFPVESGDEWRFRLGMYFALVDDPKSSARFLDEVIEDPASPGSEWVSAAQAFKETYQGPDDIYRACAAAPACPAAEAIRFLISHLKPDEFPRAIEMLWEAGVTLHNSGYFDFDLDGVKERWFTVRHRPQEKLEFWILAPYPGGVKPILVGNIVSNTPPLKFFYEAPGVDIKRHPLLIQLEEIGFIYTVDADTGEPSIQYQPLRLQFPNRFEEGVEAAEVELFSGGDPAQVKRDLLLLEDNPGLLCKATWSCDRYYYLLAVSSELSGDERQATNAYLRLWWDYSKSPYTLSARLRLKGAAVLPSPTATLTPSITPTPTRTPTVTGTPPTSTPTVTGTPPTSTPTPTVTGTPPTETPTVTGTPPTETPSPTPTDTPTPT